MTGTPRMQAQQWECTASGYEKERLHAHDARSRSPFVCLVNPSFSLPPDAPRISSPSAILDRLVTVCRGRQLSSYQSQLMAAVSDMGERVYNGAGGDYRAASLLTMSSRRGKTKRWR